MPPVPSVLRQAVLAELPRFVSLPAERVDQVRADRRRHARDDEHQHVLHDTGDRHRFGDRRNRCQHAHKQEDRCKRHGTDHERARRQVLGINVP